MEPNQVLRGWGQILAGRKPFLSLEITRECPLRCPGCYAYEPQHLGGGIALRDLADYRGDDLVDRVLALIDELRPLHVSIVGGDPLVRYRELEKILPALAARGLNVQLVTSAFRPLPAAWDSLPRLNVVVSIDGLQPEHDARRRPATYDRILKNIAGRRVSVHWTVTAQALCRPTYIREFLDFWAPRPETRRVWISIFTPQQGDTSPEILAPGQRRFLIEELLRLRSNYPKLEMPEEIVREFAHPPRSPHDCIFARTTETISADLVTRIGPCQFGGNPDCSQCGCVASMGLASLGHTQLVPGLTLGGIMRASSSIGGTVNRGRAFYRKLQCQLRSMLLPACSRGWPRPKSKSPAC